MSDTIIESPVLAYVDAETRKAMVDKVYALAYENEKLYGCCPQCVLAAIQDVFGIIDNATFKASHSLAGGGGLMGGGTCGALSGGMLALGARYGRDREHFGTGRFMQSYRLGQRLYDQFVTEFGSPTCVGVLTGLFGRAYDMWDSKDFKAYEEAGGHRDKCTRVAATTAAWAAELLFEAEAKYKS